MDCCDYECNEGYNCPIRGWSKPQTNETDKDRKKVCPPCHGDCRQGRDCPANKGLA